MDRTRETRVADRLRRARGNVLGRTATVARLALRMMLHDKAKFAGTILGVVFAVVLAAQQIGVLLGLLQKNTMFVDNAGADIWIAPPETRLLQPGKRLPANVLQLARAADGVKDASALIYAGGTIQRPWGGNEPITIVGVDLGTGLGKPWNVVAGDGASLAAPNAMFFEDSKRDKLGGLNLGSIREVNGREVRVAGFTWGLLPFGPPYAFAELDAARQMIGAPSDGTHYVLVRVQPGRDPASVAAELARQLPELSVLTREQFHSSIVRALLSEQLGMTFGTSTAFGLVIGFIIVALSMFSSVLDHLREFGTLKAVGVDNRGLSVLLLVQSVAYAVLGSVVGLGLVAMMAEGIRSPNLSVIVPWPLLLATPLIMALLCAVASALALRRVRRLDPGMVFR
jgi:putative ABC transport system permease protein